MWGVQVLRGFALARLEQLVLPFVDSLVCPYQDHGDLCQKFALGVTPSSGERKEPPFRRHVYLGLHVVAFGRGYFTQNAEQANIARRRSPLISFSTRDDSDRIIKASKSAHIELSWHAI